MDGYRREARKLEQVIESSLHELAVSDSGEASVVDKKIEEIEKSINELQLVISSMERSESAGTASNRAQIARWKEILLEFRNEFRRTQNSINQKRETLALFGPSASLLESTEGLTANELFHRERNAINGSMRGIDSSIAQAIAIKDTIQNQTETMKSSSSRLSQIAQAFPSVNDLIKTIGKRKTRDNMIVAGAIGICTIIILYSWIG